MTLGILERRFASFTARECYGSYDANINAAPHIRAGQCVCRNLIIDITCNVLKKEEQMGFRKMQRKIKLYAFLALIFMLYTSIQKTPGSPQETTIPETNNIIIPPMIF